MTEADFKDDPNYADFLTPTCECYEDDEVDDVKEKYDVDAYDKYV
jgi:hypothetical protein